MKGSDDGDATTIFHTGPSNAFRNVSYGDRTVVNPDARHIGSALGCLLITSSATTVCRHDCLGTLRDGFDRSSDDPLRQLQCNGPQPGFLRLDCFRLRRGGLQGMLLDFIPQAVSPLVRTAPSQSKPTT